MNGAITIHPGWPLTVRDYEPLLAEMRRQLPDMRNVTVAHSRGALDALASSDPGGHLVLMAPSHPRRRRPADRITRPLLHRVGHVPFLAPRFAESLRRRSFDAFGMEAGPGDPLSLVEAANRLRPFPGFTEIDRSLVVTSPEDRRHAEQLELAEELGASVLLIDGGHMFPLARPVQTGTLIAEALFSCRGAEFSCDKHS